MGFNSGFKGLKYKFPFQFQQNASASTLLTRKKEDALFEPRHYISTSI